MTDSPDAAKLADQVAALAGKIVEAITAHLAVSGPYRSLEEFLAPLNGAGSASLLGAAAGSSPNLPASVREIQHLTQRTSLPPARRRRG